MIAQSTPRNKTRLFAAMRRCLLTFGLALALPSAATARDATGVWRTEATQEGYLEVGIAPCGASHCGTILRARDPQGREQPYPHVGRWMIRNMAATGTDSRGNGQIWDPRSDRTFRSRMELSGDMLAVSDCVLGLCQSQN